MRLVQAVTCEECAREDTACTEHLLGLPTRVLLSAIAGAVVAAFWPWRLRRG